MPYTMTHLIISQNLYNNWLNNIKNLPQFYLGVISPDAVHNRDNYLPEYKKESHLCVGDEKWGMITNNDEWMDNILKFLKENISTKNHDFILGYCSHILADLFHNINIWTPLRLENPELMENMYNYNTPIRHEINMIDIELALSYNNREIFWVNLQNSESINISNIIYSNEIDIQKNNILNIWYKDKKHQNISIEKINETMDFIKKATDFIQKTLNGHL
jgi:hypothetical protein